MVEMLQISMFLFILLLSFTAFALVLRAEAVKSGYVREKKSSAFESTPSISFKKSY
ncbi:hypothetical protein [Bacillus sp. N1-1]|uniref:hypothetical protein n=1 Tax=Bacillus sp. N1-1 TaxID=2682541 RepID=UPI001316A4A8|nr:hypothetical protein [Bacillus sp. N1-1]QHA90193.1 hypothetical protein GNK04_01205 [Bacillus sp. N1-1]